MAIHLNQSDRDIIQKLITDSKAPNPLNADQFEQLATAPDVYIAKPVDDIPKLLSGCIPGTGTIICGTGSAESGSAYDEPGVAICNLYKIIVNYTTGDPELHQMLKDQKVYNLDSTDVETTWILAVRTKWGNWIAIPNRPRSVKFELLQTLAKFPNPIVPVLAAYRNWVTTLNNNHGGWETDCDDTFLVADYNEVGYEANVGGFGVASLHLRAREPRTVGTITDLCCPGDEKGTCVGT